MYTYYFQEVRAAFYEKNRRFKLIGSKSHASGVQASDAKRQFTEQELRNLLAAGYRVVINPTPKRRKELDKVWKYQEEREPAELKVAKGFVAHLPPTMFAVERVPLQTEYQVSELPATLPEHNGSILRYVPDDVINDQNPDFILPPGTDAGTINGPDPATGIYDGCKYHSGGIPCGEETPAPEPESTIYRKGDDGIWRYVSGPRATILDETAAVRYKRDQDGRVNETIFTPTAIPGIGPVPPMASLAPIDTGEQYRPGIVADGLPLDSAPEGTMLDPRESTILKRPIFKEPLPTSQLRYGFRRPEEIPAELPKPTEDERKAAAEVVAMRREGFTRMDTPTLIQKIGYRIWKWFTAIDDQERTP